MNKQVEELVEWVADILIKYNQSHCPDNSSEQQCADLKSCCSICWTKHILSHKDLALVIKPQYIDWNTDLELAKQSILALVIPLAEALERKLTNEN